MGLNKKEGSMSDEIVNLVVEDIKNHEGFDRKILEEQERTWVSFDFEVPKNTKTQVITEVKRKTGKNVRWLRSGYLEINFFAEDELAEIRHRKQLPKKEEELKSQPSKKKKRENIPRPDTLNSKYPKK